MSCNTCSDLIKTCTGPSLCIPGTTSRRIHSSSRCRLSAAVCGLGLQILSRALLQHNPGTRGSTYFHKSRLATLHSTYTMAQRLLYTEIGCGCSSLRLEQAAKPPSSSWALQPPHHRSGTCPVLSYCIFWNRYVADLGGHQPGLKLWKQQQAWCFWRGPCARQPSPHPAEKLRQEDLLLQAHYNRGNGKYTLLDGPGFVNSSSKADLVPNTSRKLQVCLPHKKMSSETGSHANLAQSCEAETSLRSHSRSFAPALNVRADFRTADGLGACSSWVAGRGSALRF